MRRRGNNSRVIRAGAIEVDLEARELRRDGRPVVIEEQPLQILGLLAERPGKVVSRVELLEKLWPAGSLADPDRSLDITIRRLRTALGEMEGRTNYVEVIPGRGYRFIAKVKTGLPGTQAGGSTGGHGPSRTWRASPWAAGIILVAVVVGLEAGGIRRMQEWLVNAFSPPHRIKLAVLPFTNLSKRAEDDFLSNGMTEELITRLGRLRPRQVGVIAATSVFSIDKIHPTIQEIGKRLDVGYVVEGTVSHEGNRVRIAARLIQVGDQTQLWSDSFDQPYEDVLTIESEVATRVARALVHQLLPAEQEKLAAPDAANPQAHEAYLNGRNEWRKRSAQGMLKSVDYYNQAIELDPGYASAYAGLADSYDTLGFYGIVPPGDAYGKARLAAQKALEIDGGLAEAHAALAEVLLHHDYDWAAAGQEYQQAINANSNYAAAHDEYSIFLALRGRFEEGLAEIRRAHDLDPESPVTEADWALQYFYAGKYDEGIAKCKEALQLHPGFALAHFWLGRNYEAKGETQAAIVELSEAARLEPGNPLYLSLLGHAYAAAGNRDEAERILMQLEAESSRHYVSPVLISLIYVGLGDNEKALDWAEKGYEARTPLLTRIKRDPVVGGLRKEPRFQALVRWVGPPD